MIYTRKFLLGEAKLPRLQRSSNHGSVLLNTHTYQKKGPVPYIQVPNIITQRSEHRICGTGWALLTKFGMMIHEIFQG
jgi:hypothetical protein